MTVIIRFNGSLAQISGLSNSVGEVLSSNLSSWWSESVQEALDKVGDDFPSNADSLIKKVDGKWLVKTGLLSIVCKKLKALRIDYKIEKNVSEVSFESEFNNKLRLFEARDYQLEAVDKMLRGKRGVVEAFTGSGKLAVISEFASKFSQLDNVLITVTSKLLLNQARKEMAEYLMIDESEIGSIGSGSWSIKPITVAIGDTLYSRIDQTECLDYLESVNVWVSDECHTNSNATYFTISSKLINTQFAVGLSATPFDNLLILEALFGPKLFKLDPNVGIELGVIGDPIIKFVKTPKIKLALRLNDTSVYSNWIYNQAYDAIIVNNKERNNLVVKLAVESLGEGNGPVVILVKKVGTTTDSKGKKSVSHAEIIRAIALTKGLDIPILHGGLKSSDQASLIEGLSNGSIPIVIASEKLLGVGVSIKSLSYLILALAGSDSKDIIQRLGRMLRIYEGKPRPVIYDFLDCQSWFTNQSRKRMEMLQSVYNDISVID